MSFSLECKKKVGQIGEFLNLLDKIASDVEPVKKSRWPYEQKRRAENLGRVINGSSYPGKTSPRIERLIRRGSIDGRLFSAGRAKKIRSNLAFEKMALLVGKKLPPKVGLVSRILNIPGKHPKATLFLGGAGLGYWLGRPSKDGSGQYSVPHDVYQQYGYGT